MICECGPMDVAFSKIRDRYEHNSDEQICNGGDIRLHRSPTAKPKKIYSNGLINDQKSNNLSF